MHRIKGSAELSLTGIALAIAKEHLEFILAIYVVIPIEAFAKKINFLPCICDVLSVVEIIYY